MTKQRKPTVDDMYDRKQRANAESQATTLDDITVFENARNAVALLKKTFETWVVIGKAVVRARDIATERGGGKTFMRLIEQEGLGAIVNKTTASNLLRIMDQLGEVTKWHETLQPREQIDWAAPTTILKRCPVFNKPDPEKENEEKPLTMAQQTSMALANALERVAQLESREEGDRFKPTDTPKDIATVLVGMFSARKAKQIAGFILELLQERAPKPRLKDAQEEAREITG